MPTTLKDANEMSRSMDAAKLGPHHYIIAVDARRTELLALPRTMFEFFFGCDADELREEILRFINAHPIEWEAYLHDEYVGDDEVDL